MAHTLSDGERDHERTVRRPPSPRRKARARRWWWWAATPGLPADPSPPPSSQAELFQAFLGLLERLAAKRTVVLVLEDLHWADRSTRQLLAFVVHALRSQTEKTASVHVSNILRKLGVAGRGEAAAAAYRRGLVG